MVLRYARTCNSRSNHAVSQETADSPDACISPDCVSVYTHMHVELSNWNPDTVVSEYRSKWRPIRVGTSEKGCEHEGVRITATSSRRALAKSRARQRHTKSSLSYDLIRKGELTNQKMRARPKTRELGLELGHPQSPSHQLDRDVDIHTQV